MNIRFVFCFSILSQLYFSQALKVNGKVVMHVYSYMAGEFSSEEQEQQEDSTGSNDYVCFDSANNEHNF